MRRIFPFAVICIGLLLLMAGPAGAGSYPPGGPRIAVSDSTVTRGETIVVSGSRWLPGSTVHISFDDPVERTAAVNGSTRFSAPITVPTGSRLGRHSITVTGRSTAGNPATRTLVVDVVGSGSGLAFTGANVTLWMIVIPVFAVVGFAFLLLGRRRRTHVGER